jgi:hypothetical protein
MSIRKKEMDSIIKFLEELVNLLPIKKKEINEFKAQKGMSLKQPTLGVCSIKLNDNIISDFELRYFPSNWNWGKKQDFLRKRIYLQEITLKNPISSLTKAPFFAGAGIYSIQGNEEIKEKKGFRKTEIVGYKFKSLGKNKENKKIAEMLNSDKTLIQTLNQEFSISKGRPLPDISIKGKIIPFGGFNIFNLDDESEKITEQDFWKVEDPNITTRLVQRFEALKRLAEALTQS